MDLNKAIESIEKQLKEFVGDRKAVIGLSGGIDSTVIAYLCVRALGGGNVLGISMPCNGDGRLNVSTQSSIDDAVLVASTLGIPYKMRGIEKAVKAFGDMESGAKDLTMGNIMARVRMVTLYMYANEINGMVIGTTNKTEAMIGYYTKYGDGAVDVEPIAALYKTDVWKMAKILGVPRQIINKKPSAELWEGHSDEDEFGMTYQEMDDILKDIVKASDKWVNKLIMKEAYGTKSFDAICLKHGEGNVLKVTALMCNSEHKKHMPPAFDIEV